MTAPVPPAVAVLVPVKAFHEAKLRLATALDAGSRADLARAMASNVVAAAGGLPVSVVCDDPEVAAWADTVGAAVIWRPGRGLNGAVSDGVASLAASGFERVIVMHADLPHALDLGSVLDFDGITLVPDRRDDGTNVVSVPSASGFEFSYGPRSFARHCAEAARLGLPLRLVREPRLTWDVDIPDDLAVPTWLAP
jgi:2-phospho-L-lactate/phosphoenolpyruvate guanylyltransferase